MGVWGGSKRRDAWALTAKRGEGAQDEAEVRREAWYDERWAAAAWNEVEGEGGAEMVGEDEVSMARSVSASAAAAVVHV